tara:strand:+ start:704 stop:1477 length:774 start_codon:yes stop_codon:yes gene_type:complete
MANNKYSGYTPKGSNQKREKGTTEINNRLNHLNPFEFRKGMDFELTNMGISRLAESTPKERQNATEKVVKNLGKHDGYYTSFITYETTYRNVKKKPSFQKWLKEQEETKMKATETFNKKGKRKSLVTLKEAIKTQIRILMEAKKDKDVDSDDDEPSTKQIKKQTGVEKSIADTAMVLQQAKSELPNLKKYFNNIKTSMEADVKDLKEKLANKDISQADYDAQYQGINAKLKNDQKVQSYVKFRRLLKDAGLLTNETY